MSARNQTPGLEGAGITGATRMQVKFASLTEGVDLDAKALHALLAMGMPNS